MNTPSFPLALICSLLAAGMHCSGDALRHEAYVWQRAWTDEVQIAVTDHGTSLSSLVALKAEVTWRNGEPDLARVPVAYTTLARTGRPVGLAMRIGPYQGPFAGTTATYVSGVARDVVSEARAAGLKLSELQVDFDCAASKLEGYRTWVQAIRKEIAPLLLVFTALPSWLEEPAFRPLAFAADGFVLQVHSLERPTNYETSFTLCDPENAKRAVDQAGLLNVPFRVALPTYGYLVAFDKNGSLLGLSADGPRKNWPSDARFREVRADAGAMARLVQFWSSNRPSSMKGVIWYRLPVSGDVFNWRWPTLSAILASRIPRESVRATSRRVEAGLAEVSLVNEGELDISSRLIVRTRWQNARFVAGDGLRGFEVADQNTSSATFDTGPQPYRLPAGEKHVIGWVRLSEDREVQVELEKFAAR